MAKAFSNHNVLSAKFTLANFEGEWLRHLGRPALNGIWFVFGKSGSGKTTYCLQLAKYLTQFVKRIGYNSLEQGLSPSMQQAWRKAGLEECGRRIMLIERESLEELEERLKKKQSPDVIFIDSVLYLANPAREIIALRHKFPTKLFIILGQERNSDVWDAKQMKIKHDADIKIRLVGGVARCETRYSTADGYGGADFVAYEKLKEKFNAEIKEF
ncbi:ATP-binding protein [Porphyromonas gingivicanis]|uniref:ATP-binding protein n=1 Tax=Porphyromonas gingivicanis TaxID=266762 RepID=UPI00046F8DE2|nr:ATP-binding protein [Porphyromonas gingivicanis]